MISREVAERKTHMWWDWEWGALIDSSDIMMIVHGKHDKFIHPGSKRVHEGYIFVGFQEFLDKGLYKNKAIMYGSYGVKEHFVRKASLLIPNMEVGIPNHCLPFIFRNENMTLYVAPCTIDDDLVDKIIMGESAW